MLYVSKIQGRRYTYGEIAKDEDLFQWVQGQNRINYTE